MSVAAKSKANKLRIVIVGLNFFPELTGVGKYTGELAEVLSRVGHEVHVITTPPYYPQWRVPRNYQAWRYRKETWHAIEVMRCPIWVPHPHSGLRRALHLLSFVFSSMPVVLSQVRWKPHLVMSIAPTILSAPSALLLAKVSRSRSWLHIQDYELDAGFSLHLLPKVGLFQKVLGGLEKLALTRFDRVSSITPAMVDRALKKGVTRDRLELVPNWVDTNEIHPDGSSPELFGLPADRVIALYSGNLGQKQGLTSLFDVAKLLEAVPNIYFVICGEGANRSEVEAFAREIPNLQFLPLQPEANLNALLNVADIHLLPEISGASDLVMPSKLGGMLASGRATVASAKVGSEIERIVQDVGVVVPPGDIKAMANAIQRLAEDSLLRLQMGCKARIYAEEHLSKEVILRRVADKMEEWVR